MLWPVVKLVNDMRQLPPTFASMLWTLAVKPFCGSHSTIALASRKARYPPLGECARDTVALDGAGVHGRFLDSAKEKPFPFPFVCTPYNGNPSRRPAKAA